MYRERYFVESLEADWVIQANIDVAAKTDLLVGRVLSNYINLSRLSLIGLR